MYYTVYSAATSHRLPGAAALTYLTNFIVPGGRSVRLSALLIACIEVTPSDASSPDCYIEFDMGAVVTLGCARPWSSTQCIVYDNTALPPSHRGSKNRTVAFMSPGTATTSATGSGTSAGTTTNEGVEGGPIPIQL